MPADRRPPAPRRPAPAGAPGRARAVATALLAASAAALACGASGADGPTAGGDCPEGNARLCGMVAAHDAARAGVRPAPGTPLPAMHWDAAAAAAAQAWADQCRFSHSAAGYGQNLYASAGSGYPAPQAAVGSWMSEAASYDYASNTCSGTCGHYTQVVWRTSTGLGCGIKACSTNSPFGGFRDWYLVVCNYSPPGNYVGQRPY